MLHFQIKLLRMIYYLTTKENQDEERWKKNINFYPSVSVDLNDDNFFTH